MKLTLTAIESRFKDVFKRLFDDYGIIASDPNKVSNCSEIYEASSNCGKIRITVQYHQTKVSLPLLIKHNGDSFFSKHQNVKIQNILNDFNNQAQVLKAINLKCSNNSPLHSFFDLFRIGTLITVKSRKNTKSTVTITLTNKLGYSELLASDKYLGLNYNWSYTTAYLDDQIHCNQDFRWLKEKIHEAFDISKHKKIDNYSDLSSLTQMILY